MKLKLIPVIEILNFNESIQCPDSAPFWQYEDEWEVYNQLCNKAAGFSDDLKPYQKASSFYEIDKLSTNDLSLAIQKEIDFEDTNDIIHSFFGGFILELDNVGVYFPQCCGSLADIAEWQNLIIGKTSSFFAGHPFPRITENETKIRFDFIDVEVKEKFTPPTAFDVLEIEKLDLEIAIIEVNKALNAFADKLVAINKAENFNIKNIERKLIWGETEI